MNKTHIEFQSGHGFIASLCRKNMQYTEPRTVLNADDFVKTPDQYKCKICTKVLQRELQESEALASYTELEAENKRLREYLKSIAMPKELNLPEFDVDSARVLAEEALKGGA